MLQTLAQDLRYAIRVLSKNPGVTAIAVLTLALGIGANTAIFSVLDPLLLQKLPVQRPDDLVRLDAAGSLGDVGMFEASAAERFRDQSAAFAGVLSFVPSSFDDVTHDGRSGPARAEMVSANYFSVLGLAPFLGRVNFTESELGNTVVLGFDYWRSDFGRDSAVIGKSLVVQGSALTIVGVAPPDFFGMKVGEYTDIYVPAAPGGILIGRLKPGISAAQALTASEPAFQQIRKESEIPEIEQRQEMDHLVFTSAARGLSSVRAQFSLPARILMGVAALVLLIACANVANLLLAQGSVRRREIAVRVALGASRRRLIHQLMTEGALLTIVGAAAGLIAANWTSKLIVASLSDIRTHVVLATSLSSRSVLFSLASAIVTMILCGVLPALSATRVDISQDMKIGGAGARRGATGKLGGILVVGQVAMSVTALAAGGVLLHSLVNLETMDIGFDRNHVVAVDMTGDASGHTPQQIGKTSEGVGPPMSSNVAYWML